MSIDLKEIPYIPISLGEFGFNLEINSILHNLNDEIIHNFVLYMFLSVNFNRNEVPKNDKCIRAKNLTLIPQKVSKKTVSSKNDFVYCEL